MDSALLSIVVPIYNTESYLERCLESIVRQPVFTEREVELILVNDGSTDTSAQICVQFVKAFHNVKYIKQENQGLSMARNNGLEQTSGRFVWFIDSDDSISDNALSDILEKIESNEDLYVMNFRNSNSNQVRNPFAKDGRVRAVDFLSSPSYQACAWSYLYKRDFLERNHLRFAKGLYHEDEEFSLRAVYLAGSIYCIKKVLYLVDQREGSITRSNNPKRSFDLLQVIESLDGFKKNVAKGEDAPLFNNRIGLLFNSAIANMLRMDSLNRKAFQKEVLQNSVLPDALLSTTVLKYRMEGILLQVLRGKFFWVYRLVKKLI